MWREIFTLRHLASFKGRATRREFLAIAALWLIPWMLPAVLVSVATGKEPPEWAFAFGGVWMLAYLIAVFAAAVRRLHDHDKSGAYLFLGLIPFVGWIFLLIMMFYTGNYYENNYGPDPREQILNEQAAA